jgi:hypothetical protein
MRSYSKKMRPGREVNLLTPRYYVFSLRGETGDSEVYRKIGTHQHSKLAWGVISGDKEKILKNCPPKKRANFEDQ